MHKGLLFKVVTENHFSLQPTNSHHVLAQSCSFISDVCLIVKRISHYSNTKGTLVFIIKNETLAKVMDFCFWIRLFDEFK